MQRPWPDDRLLAALPLMEQIKELHIPSQSRWCSLVGLLENWEFVMGAGQGVLCDPIPSWHVKIRTEVEVYDLYTLYLLLVVLFGGPALNFLKCCPSCWSRLAQVWVGAGLLWLCIFAFFVFVYYEIISRSLWRVCRWNSASVCL